MILNLIGYLFIYLFLNEGGKCFLEFFWVLIFQIFCGKSNIVVCEISRNFKTTTKAPIGQLVKLATLVEGDPKAPFSIATTQRCRGGRYSL